MEVFVGYIIILSFSVYFALIERFSYEEYIVC